MSTTGSISASAFLEAGVFELDQHFFPRPWKIEDWRGLNPLHHKLFLRKEESVLLGFSLFGLLPADETAHLLKICLDPRVRGSGEALLFWGEILQELKESGVKSIFLEVEEPNLRAIAFYQKVGFSKLRTIKSYYSDGTSGVTMSLTL